MKQSGLGRWDVTGALHLDFSRSQFCFYAEQTPTVESGRDESDEIFLRGVALSAAETTGFSKETVRQAGEEDK